MKITFDCESHGFRRPAYVCQHLNLKNKKGFEESFEAFREMELEDEDDFCAGCNDCEKIRIEQDGWNDESEKFAKIKLVCEECFFEFKEFSEN